MDDEEVWVPRPYVGPRVKTPSDAPDDLEIRPSAPEPLTTHQAHLGVSLNGRQVDGRDRPHRLVTIGDSLTQGFQSLAIAKTELSWPMIVARSFGFSLSHPEFTGPIGSPGLPLNLEGLARAIDDALGQRALAFQEARALVVALKRLTAIRRYWVTGLGSHEPAPRQGFYENLAIWGWDVRDALSKSRSWCQEQIDTQSTWRERIGLKDRLMTVHANERTAIRTLANATPAQTPVTQISAAQELGAEGIDTLVVALGANNALGAVGALQIRWSGPGYESVDEKNRYNVWTPTDFRSELGDLVEGVDRIESAHTIWFTVPHVTVAPILRGMGDKPYYSRYFARYAHAWQSEAAFDANADPSLSGDEARMIDAAIDQYNWAIKRAVRDARAERGRDWFVMDLCGLLDRLAYRRYLESPGARPGWMPQQVRAGRPTTPTGGTPGVDDVLPPELLALSPRPDTRFLSSDRKGRTQGGLIALDGVHPTTIGYGLIAREVAEILTTKAGVVPVGPTATGSVDFDRLVREDSLISSPPRLLGEELRLAGVVNHLVDVAALLQPSKALG